MIDEKIRVHFILEGNEENTLFQIIEHFSNKKYVNFTFQNCKGGGKIPMYFQSALQSDNYDLIFSVYDVDYKSKDNDSMYNSIRKGLYKVLGDYNEVDKLSICSNPNILLIILLGYDNLENLKDIKADKANNTFLINKYIPKIGNKKNYDASEWQLDLIKNDFFYSDNASIYRILDNINILNKNYHDSSIASNILPVIKALIDDDINFFKKY